MDTTAPRPLVLMVLDGYGISFSDEGNAIMAAKTPNMDRYMSEYPMAAIKAAGVEAGLPFGEMGNSETGHQNIGAGRVVYQSLPRISLAIQNGSFFTNPILIEAAEYLHAHPSAALHVMGLLSNGGVHSHIDHQLALLEFAKNNSLEDKTHIHVFLDGRDSPPGSAGNFVQQLDDTMKQTGVGRISSLIGRYYAMDRAQKWERVQAAYDLLVHGKGVAYNTWQEAVQAAYKNSDTKSFETAPGMIIGNDNRHIQDGDVVLFYNYRPDRAVELTTAFVDTEFSAFPVEHMPNLKFISMTQYHDDLKTSVLFPAEKIEHTVGQVFSDHGLKQLRIAESEKFAHVTYFFDGGEEKPYKGTTQVKIPSLDVKDFSQVPAMSARKISDRVIREIAAGEYDLIVMNYANPDMVAHTGNFKATVEAVECVDEEIGRVTEAALEAGGAVLLTCDHGNAEVVISHVTHERSTDHTNNVVPLLYIASHVKLAAPKDDVVVRQILSEPVGILTDVAATLLDIAGLPKPKEMTSQSLLSSLK